MSDATPSASLPAANAPLQLPAAASSPWHPHRHADWRAGAAVALAALVAYAAALAGTFVYDDLHSVAANPGVQTLRNALRFFADPSLFSATGGEMYRPVLLLSFAVDSTLSALGGGPVSPLPFKLTNMLLHAGSAWLLLRLLRVHGCGLPAAAAAALLFAVHPLASETINFVSARSEGLLLAGVLLALLGHQALLRGSRRGQFAIVAGAVVACGSKETGVVLPGLLLVQEWLWSARVQRGAARASLRRLWPALLLVVVYLLVRRELLGQATATLAGRDGSDPMFGHTRDLVTQLATMGVLLPRALWQAVVPLGLTCDPVVAYQRSFWSLPVLAGWGSLALLTWISVRAGRAAPLRCLGAALAWAAALPWIVVPLNVPLAEHRLYAPLAGLCCILASGLDRGWQRVAAAALGVRAARAARRAAVALGVLLLSFAALSARRCLDYRDEAELWRAALATGARSFRAHWGLGTALQQRGDYAAAEASLARACAIYPGFRAARRSWVESMLHLPAAEGWPFRALPVVEELTAQKPDDPYYRLLHANVELQVGIARGDEATILAAEARVLSCLELGPAKALVFRLAAECRRRVDDLPGALAHLDAALLRGLDFAALRAERSELLRQLGRTAEADRELRAAFEKAPMDGAVRAAWARRHAAPPR